MELFEGDLDDDAEIGDAVAQSKPTEDAIHEAVERGDDRAPEVSLLGCSLVACVGSAYRDFGCAVCM